ncbi:hypothetical protein J437_LFUL009307 [Ladona fulva]|uniref:Luciferin 4-monooxygenase n=1 Tax=Ladona fulva TaxID=123851 RepID=A0A8K0K587_LADFU|nr:hypothetical protein J437_LFUL009307 [Ladona fulva]
MQLIPDDNWTALSLLPYFHSMGIMGLLRSLSTGLKTVIISHFEKKLFLETIEKYKVTVTAVVPPLALFLTKDPLVAKYDLSSISVLGMGAAPIGKEVQQNLENLINKARTRIGAPPCRVIQGYGLTEATVGVSFDRGEKSKPGSVGTLVPGLKCKVPPAELEAILHTHPSVEDVAVIGIPNEEAGEVPMAVIVKKQGREMSEEIILSGPPETEIEDLRNCLGEHFVQRLSFLGNKISQVDPITGKSYTYKEILSLSLKLAEAMRYGDTKKNWHIGTGNYVGICSENSIDFALPVLGAIYLGAAAAPINPAYSKREIEHALKISKPRVVFSSKTRLNDIIEVARSTDFVQGVVVMDEIRKTPHVKQSVESDSDGYVISINDLIHSESFVPSIPFTMDMPKVHMKDQVALLMCSSGTTGLPKGVMLTQFNLLITLFHQLRSDHEVLFNPDDVTLGILPFFHAFGLLVLLYSLFLGMTMVVMPRFEAVLYLESIQKYKVSVIITVPPLAVFLAKDPRVAEYDLSSIRQILCGAAPLGKDIQEEVENIISKAREKIGAPPCNLIQGYGLTETTLAVTMCSNKAKKYGSIGVLAPGVQCKVMDLETGKSLGPYKEGELWFRGAMIMKGYLGDAEATATTIDNNGWLHTGDVGYYDKESHFYIVDRLKELIKYKAYQVPPAELEALLLTHPAIEDAAVIGIPDESAGELPMAMVIKQPGKELTEAEVVKFIADRVSPQKRLHGGVRFVKSIPKTASGKILRRVLRESLKSKL